jgi:hypothetical protein
MGDEVDQQLDDIKNVAVAMFGAGFDTVSTALP